MVARKHGRGMQTMLFALATSGAIGSTQALAQLSQYLPRSAASKAAQAAKSQTAPAQANPTNVPRLVPVGIPVNPTDPIAIVNGEVISRSQLSDECVARKGREILETMIARKLIEQALVKRKLEVTAAEIDQEITNVAENVGHIGREAWLQTLDKERGISPVQYARDIIFPALALRKLASDRVQVTPKDMKDSFEAQYGDKLKCRIIMVDKLLKAQTIWDKLRQNPAGFEKLAQDFSMDAGSRSLGGLLAEPITRHAYPQNVSDAAFYQLVDGDPKDKDPSHKPKDGDFTGPIQVAESTWILLRRESIIPGQPVDANSEKVRQGVYSMIYEVKLKEAMTDYFAELSKVAAVENRLTGHIKQANEEQERSRLADGDVKLMSNPDGAIKASAEMRAGAAGSPKLPTPAAASQEVVKQVESLQAPPK
jgi:parvulin-like peptidyl-prolyl isomerase